MTGGSSRLVVLGSCGAWPEAGRACSGFLVEHAGFRVVLDLGYAVLPRLLTALDSSVADGLDAVIVTHRHADHAIDLHGLFRARWFGRRGAPRLPLYCGRDVLDQLIAIEGDPEPVESVFAWDPLPASPYPLGPFELRSWALPHFVPNVGVRLSAPGLSIAYTGDTGPDPALVELGRGADVYIMEASDRGQQPGAPAAPAGPRLQLNSRDAGEVAAAAAARRLLLTHFWPGNDRAASREVAVAAFAGEVLLADEGLEIELN